jgi:hypothetical protein
MNHHHIAAGERSTCDTVCRARRIGTANRDRRRSAATSLNRKRRKGFQVRTSLTARGGGGGRRRAAECPWSSTYLSHRDGPDLRCRRYIDQLCLANRSALSPPAHDTDLDVRSELPVPHLTSAEWCRSWCSAAHSSPHGLPPAHSAERVDDAVSAEQPIARRVRTGEDRLSWLPTYQRRGLLTMECRKCHRRLHDCQGCNGGRASGLGGKLGCSKCNSTGLVCSQHGGHWK